MSNETAMYPAPASAEEQQRFFAEAEKMAEGPRSPDDGFDWLGDPADEVPIADPELLTHFVAQLREAEPSLARTIALRLYATLLAARREMAPTCRAESPEGYGCELPNGHGGDHGVFLNEHDERGKIPEVRWPTPTPRPAHEEG